MRRANERARGIGRCSFQAIVNWSIQWVWAPLSSTGPTFGLSLTLSLSAPFAYCAQEALPPGRLRTRFCSQAGMLFHATPSTSMHRAMPKTCHGDIPLRVRRLAFIVVALFFHLFAPRSRSLFWLACSIFPLTCVQYACCPTFAHVPRRFVVKYAACDHCGEMCKRKAVYDQYDREKNKPGTIGCQSFSVLSGYEHRWI